MNTVFVVSAVNGKNLLPAKKYGKLHVILTGGETIWQAMCKLQCSLDQMKEEDYLLLIGNPLFIACASSIAFQKLGTVNFLIWDRVNYGYDMVTVPINYGKYQPTNATTSK